MPDPVLPESPFRYCCSACERRYKQLNPYYAHVMLNDCGKTTRVQREELMREVKRVDEETVRVDIEENIKNGSVEKDTDDEESSGGDDGGENGGKNADHDVEGSVCETHGQSITDVSTGTDERSTTKDTIRDEQLKVERRLLKTDRREFGGRERENVDEDQMAALETAKLRETNTKERRHEYAKPKQPKIAQIGGPDGEKHISDVRFKEPIPTTVPCRRSRSPKRADRDPTTHYRERSPQHVVHVQDGYRNHENFHQKDPHLTYRDYVLRALQERRSAWRRQWEIEAGIRDKDGQMRENVVGRKGQQPDATSQAGFEHGIQNVHAGDREDDSRSTQGSQLVQEPDLNPHKPESVHPSPLRNLWVRLGGPVMRDAEGRFRPGFTWPRDEQKVVEGVEEDRRKVGTGSV